MLFKSRVTSSKWLNLSVPAFNIREAVYFLWVVMGIKAQEFMYHG